MSSGQTLLLDAWWGNGNRSGSGRIRQGEYHSLFRLFLEQISTAAECLKFEKKQVKTSGVDDPISVIKARIDNPIGVIEAGVLSLIRSKSNSKVHPL